MTDLPPYNPDARCPKCHSTDIAAQHVPFVSRADSWRPVSMGEPVPGWLSDSPEYMRRTCLWCKYTWDEAPLDIVREIDVRSEAE